MSASRNQRRFFSSIVAKCTSCRLRGRGYTASLSPWGSSVVMCVELVVKGISLTCSSTGMRNAKVMLPPCFHCRVGDGPVRPGSVKCAPICAKNKYSSHGIMLSLLFLCTSHPVPYSDEPTIFVSVRTQSTGTIRNGRKSRFGHGVLGP